MFQGKGQLNLTDGESRPHQKRHETVARQLCVQAACSLVAWKWVCLHSNHRFWLCHAIHTYRRWLWSIHSSVSSQMSSVFTSAISSKSNLWSSLYDWTLLTPLPFALPTTDVRLAPLKQPRVPNPSLMCIQARPAQSNACFWTAADSVKPHLYECKATSWTNVFQMKPYRVDKTNASV